MKKVVAKAMRRETEQQLIELGENLNHVYKLLKIIKMDGKDVEGGRCMRGTDGRLSFSVTNRGKTWKEHMEKIMRKMIGITLPK